MELYRRDGQPVCQHFMRTGTRKYGGSCKYHHPRQGSVSVAPVSLSYLGYPLRLGEKECSYYMRTGQCKFGLICKFNHHVPQQHKLDDKFRFVGSLSGWTATLKFMWMPVSQMWTNFLNPDNIKGLSPTTMVLAMMGNGLMIPGALFIHDLM
ncbi:unnamed protein product [Eruca vesicaria subsp. sativa]|uniref:C3H1-type domain-containing protein n=1 Tax=Eruca vesicaria subsp. sativa TaxID=29727 RepID=A0ABC8K5T7_ERUVS|nr:unnamed protein product [Eruca vesicaria subsp. sativa]